MPECERDHEMAPPTVLRRSVRTDRSRCGLALALDALHSQPHGSPYDYIRDQEELQPAPHGEHGLACLRRQRGWVGGWVVCVCVWL